MGQQASLDSIELWSRRRVFLHDVKEEIKEARGLFRNSGHHLELDHPDLPFWGTVITEELGKLTRAMNKLEIASDHESRAEWMRYGRGRIVTTTALLHRLAEVWKDYE